MKKIVFITGTRADYGKLKSIIVAVESSKKWVPYVYVTGMHLLPDHGSTYRSVLNDNYDNIFVEHELSLVDSMDTNIGNTIVKMAEYIHKIRPDIIVVHGDRIDALAGAIVGILNSIIVIHVEGGEKSGTVDDSLRHAITKLSHVHCCANEESRRRILQLGEPEEQIFVTGSPDIDIMLSSKLPSSKLVLRENGIPFDEYAIFIYHPVTTEVESCDERISACISALLEAGHNYIVILPNNDTGSQIIRKRLESLRDNKRFCIVESFPFEDFLALLKDSSYIIGNSSAGIREASVFGIPCINIGSRQNGRYNPKILRNINTVEEDCRSIVEAIGTYQDYQYVSYWFGDGHASELFLGMLERIERVVSPQKVFVDIGHSSWGAF